jgi:hypothetical protein
MSNQGKPLVPCVEQTIVTRSLTAPSLCRCLRKVDEISISYSHNLVLLSWGKVRHSLMQQNVKGVNASMSNQGK